MRPVRFSGSNRVLKMPPGQPGEDLHVYTDGEQVVSLWELDARDRAIICNSDGPGEIWLAVLSGETSPPVKLMVNPGYGHDIPEEIQADDGFRRPGRWSEVEPGMEATISEAWRGHADDHDMVYVVDRVERGRKPKRAFLSRNGEEQAVTRLCDFRIRYPAEIEVFQAEAWAAHWKKFLESPARLRDAGYEMGPDGEILSEPGGPVFGSALSIDRAVTDAEPPPDPTPILVDGYNDGLIE